MCLTQAIGCCLFPVTDVTEIIPLEARWLFNDMTKTTGDGGIKCTFVSPLTDKVRLQCIVVPITLYT